MERYRIIPGASVRLDELDPGAADLDENVASRELDRLKARSPEPTENLDLVVIR